MDELVNMINGTGFPIVMCLLMYKSNMDNAKVIGDLKEIINENTGVIKALWNKIDEIKREGI